MKKNIQKICLTSVLVLGIFALTDFAFASCPDMTTVSGTDVTFVGELTDTGGDESTSVWFEYGKTTSYGYKTSEKTMSSAGIYCIDVSGLSPCTTYHYRAAAKNSAGTSYGEDKTFTTTCQGVSVDIKANGSNGPVTIPYNTSATLKWTSSNADSCYASGSWSGTKATSGSQSTGKLTSNKTYTITCEGPGGSDSDTVKVYVEEEEITEGQISLRKTVKNITKGTNYADSVYANPGDVLNFGIVIKAKNNPLYDVTVKDTLPAGIIYKGDLRIDNVLTSGNILTGLSLGDLEVNEEKTITFQAEVAGTESFAFGQTELTNTVLVSSEKNSRSDTAKVIVNKAAVAGTATGVSTGLTNNIFLDSFFLPLVLTLLIIWIFRSRIIKFEEWLDSRKEEYQRYKTEKLLKLKIAQIKAKEFLQRKI